MLESLKSLPRRDVEVVLAAVAGSVLPSPTPERRIGSIEVMGVDPEAVLAEVREHLRLRPEDTSVEALATIYDFLFSAIAEESLRPGRRAAARMRLGRKGELPPHEYEVGFADWAIKQIREFSIRQTHVEEAVSRPDMFDHLRDELFEERGFAPISVYVKNIARSPQGLSLLVVAIRDGVVQRVQGAWRVYHDVLDPRNFSSPVQLLRAFFDAYGVDLFVGAMAKRLYLFETLPLPSTYRPERGPISVFDAHAPDSSGFTGAYLQISRLGVVE
jgi:hypothetical protein